jgi:hypothetical protein
MKNAFLVPIALCLATCASTPSAQQYEARGRELLAQMKAAMGGPALDAPSGFHETGVSVRDDGAKMTYESWGDLHTLRSASVQTVDGRKTLAGFDGEAGWHVLPNESVQKDTDAHTIFVVTMASYLAVGGYFYPDRFPAKVKYLGRERASDAKDDDGPAKASKGPATADDEQWDVVEVWPDKTLPVNLWLDTETHRLERISGRISNDETFTSVIEDYRQVDGVWTGFRTTQIDEEHTVKQTRMTFAFEAVPPERFSPPKR